MRRHEHYLPMLALLHRTGSGLIEGTTEELKAALSSYATAMLNTRRNAPARSPADDGSTDSHLNTRRGRRRRRRLGRTAGPLRPGGPWGLGDPGRTGATRSAGRDVPAAPRRPCLEGHSVPGGASMAQSARRGIGPEARLGRSVARVPQGLRVAGARCDFQVDARLAGRAAPAAPRRPPADPPQGRNGFRAAAGRRMRAAAEDGAATRKRDPRAANQQGRFSVRERQPRLRAPRFAGIDGGLSAPRRGTGRAV